MKSTILFPYLILLFVPVSRGMGQAVMGARPVAMGQATSAIPDMEWSVFANPAMMDDGKRSVSFFGIRYYGFSEITDIAASINYPTGWGTVGAGVHRYGFDLFNESRIRIGYKNSYRNFYYGAVLNYSHIAQGGGYGSAGALGVDAGIGASIFERFWIGARATNINQPEYGDGDVDVGEALPRELAIGFSCRLSDTALFASDLVKDVRFPVSYRGGVEVFIFDRFAGRAGITTEPTTFSLGFGYSAGFWSINLVAQNHEELGVSPGFDLGIAW